MVDKIEPQATVVQNVTMFPVIVSLDNSLELLKPGMNAEVEVLIDEALDVVLVPNNAIVQTSDVGPAAMALGLNIDEMDLTQFMRGGRGGSRGGQGFGGGRGEVGMAGLNLKVLKLQAERVIALREMVRVIKAALWLSFRNFVRKSRVERSVRMRCVL